MNLVFVASLDRCAGKKNFLVASSRSHCEATADKINGHADYDGAPTIGCSDLAYANKDDCTVGAKRIKGIIACSAKDCGNGECSNGKCIETCGCPEMYAPVCGTDGKSFKTFNNACEANCAEMKVVSEGECKKSTTATTAVKTTTAVGKTTAATTAVTKPNWVQCTSDDDCKKGEEVCAKGPKMIGLFCTTATTTADTCSCGKIYAPVCGANGKTFNNACEANCAKMKVVSDGECPTAAAAATTNLGVNAACDPRNDQCDANKALTCDVSVYECRYAAGLPTTNASSGGTAATTDTVLETSNSPTLIVVVVVVVVVAVLLVVAGVVMLARKRDARTEAAQQGGEAIALRERAASEITIGHTYTNPLAKVKITEDQHYGEINGTDEPTPVESKPFKGIVFGSGQHCETVLDEFVEVADDQLPPGSRPAAWFVGGMKREACKKLVRAGDEHQFLVRTSATVAHGYVICFNLDGQHVQEDIVRKRPDGRYSVKFHTKPFASIKELIIQWQTHTLEPKAGMAFTLGNPVPHTISKFIGDEITLRCGERELSAMPLEEVLGVDPAIFHVKNKVKAVMEEIRKYGSKQDYENATRLLDETYKTPETGPDEPPQHNPLSKVMLTKEAKDSGLQLHQALVLQLYTTSTYSSINNPLREGRKPNLLPLTTYFISEGLKRLRVHSSKSPSGGNKERTYWRGMQNMKVSDKFMADGGAEMACMSTTSSKAVAIEFAGKKCPVLFKCVSRSFMSHGAEISFLSVYPGEKEVAFPPMTYLHPTGSYEEVIDGVLMTIVVMEPIYPN